MKSYEIFVILDPRLSEEEVSTFAQKLRQTIGSEDVSFKDNEVKMNQRLSYPIKHQKTGHFVRLYAESAEAIDLAQKVNEELKTDENVMRRIVISRPAGATKEKKPVSVIDQLRRQQRTDRVTTQKQQVPYESRTAPEQPQIEEKKANIEEIDKRIEELLQ